MSYEKTYLFLWKNEQPVSKKSTPLLMKLLIVGFYAQASERFQINYSMYRNNRSFHKPLTTIKTAKNLNTSMITDFYICPNSNR